MDLEEEEEEEVAFVLHYVPIISSMVVRSART